MSSIWFGWSLQDYPLFFQQLSSHFFQVHTSMSQGHAYEIKKIEKKTREQCIIPGFQRHFFHVKQGKTYDLSATFKTFRFLQIRYHHSWCSYAPLSIWGSNSCMLFWGGHFVFYVYNVCTLSFHCYLYFIYSPAFCFLSFIFFQWVTTQLSKGYNKLIIVRQMATWENDLLQLLH